MVVLEKVTLAIHATDSIDAGSLVSIEVFPEILAQAEAPASYLYEDTFDVFFVGFFTPNPAADVLITLTSSDDTKVKILSGSTVTIPASGTTTFVVVEGVDTGDTRDNPQPSLPRVRRVWLSFRGRLARQSGGTVEGVR